MLKRTLGFTNERPKNLKNNQKNENDKYIVNGLGNYISNITNSTKVTSKLSNYKNYMYKNYYAELCNKAIEKNNLLIFEWALQNKFKVTEKTGYLAIDYNNTDILKAFLEFYYKPNNSIYSTVKGCNIRSTTLELLNDTKNHARKQNKTDCFKIIEDHIKKFNNYYDKCNNST